MTGPITAPPSAYDMSREDEEIERRTLAVMVDNEPGVLARVVGLFAARGYNIESLTVAEVDESKHRSRITIVTSGTPHTLEQIEAQLLRLVPVGQVTDISKSKRGVERELALFKWQAKARNASRLCASRKFFVRMSSIPVRLVSFSS